MTDAPDPGPTTQTAKTSTVSRPGVIWTVACVGAVFTSSPFAITRFLDSHFGAWQVIAATTLTNIGTTVLLAAVLFYAQRNFTRDVTETVAETTRAEVKAQTQDIRRTTEALQQRLDEISEDLVDRREARSTERASVIEDLRSGVSFDTVASALELANDFNALWWGYLTVPAGEAYDSPRVRLFWGDKVGAGPFSTGHIFDDAAPTIALSYEVSLEDQSGGYTPARAFWKYEQTPSEALDDLVIAMQTAGYRHAADGITAALFTHLADALDEATAARATTKGTWMVGRLDEWLDDGWAITEEGLESRDGIRIPAAAFPDARFDAMPAEKKEPLKTFNPAPPDDIDPDFWRYAVERSRYKFKGSQSASIAASGRGPVPYTTASSARAGEDWPPVPN